MPSFWPFGRDDTSAASFEKTLSQLSTKINAAAASTDRLRSTQRRLKALWTLYASFAYILVAAILLLVTRVENWNAYEYGAVGSGPVLIWAVRALLDAWYSWRVARGQERVNELSREREVVIEKLKRATRWNSTQELLEKYGGSPPGQGGGRAKGQASPQSRKGSGRKAEGAAAQGPRTGFMPPPTANIPGRPPPPGPQISGDGKARPPGAPPPDSLLPPNGPGEEFAPNAFTHAPPPPALPQPSNTQYAAPEGPKWYDRILDVVLGEDETSAKNRIVLICGECRLVNGQAPPGARSLEEVGRWRCSACGAWNGVESVERQALKDAGLGSPTSASSHMGAGDAAGEGEEVVDAEVGGGESVNGEEDGAEEMQDVPPASSTRSKARQRKKA